MSGALEVMTVSLPMFAVSIFVILLRASGSITHKDVAPVEMRIIGATLTMSTIGLSLALLLLMTS